MITKINHYNPGEEETMKEELQEDNTYGFYKHVYKQMNNEILTSFEGEEKICDKLKLTLKRKEK